MRRNLSLFCAALAISLPAGAAQVYRCTDAAGHVEYRDLACSGDQSGGRVTIEPNVTRGLDERAMRAASKEIADRAAARAVLEQQAARARASSGASPSMPSADLPWWQQGGPPPEREKGQRFDTDAPPSAPKPPPPAATPAAPPVRPLNR